MQNTVMCYIERGDKILMLFRNGKEVDPNKGKWIGVGGHIEENESPDEALVREVMEETGLTLDSYSLKGIATFVSDKWEGEYMHIYSAVSSGGDVIECNEGKLYWVDRSDVPDLPTWEGDRLFLPDVLENRDGVFRLKLVYTGDKLTEWVRYMSK